MNDPMYQVFFIGTRRFIYSPWFAKLESAKNWLSRNKHRVVEECQIIKQTEGGYEWYYRDGVQKMHDNGSWRAAPKLKN